MDSMSSPSPTPADLSLRKQPRPDNPRSSTDPSPAMLMQSWQREKDKLDWARPSNNHRNRSPYSRGHLRSRSSGAAFLSAPLMTRSHSTPNPHTPQQFEQSAGSSANSSGSLSPSPSQQRSPARARSPFKNTPEESAMPPLRPPGWYESSASAGAIESIQEDSELDFTPRPQSAHLPQPSPLAPHSLHSRSNSLRRRPASPLYNVANAQPPTSFPASIIDQSANLTTTPSSASNSPSLGPQKYNEAYPSLHHYASSSSFSSHPSTPTSARSRSPSISSLETIEDAPEQESEAVEAERIERLKIAAERAEQGESDSEGEGSGIRRRNGSLDMPRFSRGGVTSRERKRWSVCGGERRADLDLETIWED